MKSNRTLCGYNLIYKPEHPSSMTNKKWEGYVYEHIYVVEINIKRSLKDDEVVHHLDFDKRNNRFDNLLVMLNSEHAKLHQWLSKNKIVPLKLDKKETYCKICKNVLTANQKEYCSRSCQAKSEDRRKVKQRPDKQMLLDMILSGRSLVSIGKDYNVSDNTIRKWANNYGIETKKWTKQKKQS